MSSESVNTLPSSAAKMELNRDYLIIFHCVLLLVTLLLKLILVVILVFYVAPTIDKATEQSRLNNNAIEGNRMMLEEMRAAIRGGLKETHKGKE